MKPIIEVKNLGKKYTINHHRGGYITLRDVLTSIIKNPFRFAKKKAKEIAGIDTKEDFWALKNISFKIEPGEVVGVIGSNGAGKSTLLKILTGITPPTEGEIIMRGKVASLLEVGTGFHPELTGRENIFLNGAILGMTKKEIVKKFDEIVAFAGIEKFLDTPVKYYSSGMYVRLAFSVAAHMEPDILLVDEVLAVGDAEFQKKCLGKMEEVSKASGRTILFVSHNMAAIRNLCEKTILLEDGKLKMFGDTEKVISSYLSEYNLKAVTNYLVNTNEDIQISKISIFNEKNQPQVKIPVSEDFFIKTEFEVFKPTDRAVFSIFFHADGDLLLLSSESDKNAKLTDYAPGKYTTTIKVPKFLLNVGIYSFDALLHRPTEKIFSEKKNLNFEIEDIGNTRSGVYRGYNYGKIASILDYQTRKEDGK
jgi:lipopolysaccharide transport system ATP-binding protein